MAQTPDEARASAWLDEQIAIYRRRAELQRKLLGPVTAGMDLRARWAPLYYQQQERYATDDELLGDDEC